MKSPPFLCAFVPLSLCVKFFSQTMTNNQQPDFEDLMRTWGNLWQQGFNTVWQSTMQFWNPMQQYWLGQSQVGQTPSRELWRGKRSRLLRYTPMSPRQRQIPLLIVPSLINRYYILDLLPERSLVKYLVAQGIDVYLLEWLRPSPADAAIPLDDHIDRYIDEAVAQVVGFSGQEQVSLLGYCMGGMFTAVYTALHPNAIANLVNLAGPINFHDDGIFSLFTRSDWFDADRLVDTYGNIPAQLLLTLFQMIRPTSNLLRSLYLYERADDPDYVRSFAAMQTWILDQVDFPGETFRRYVKALYQGNELVNGRFTIHNQPVNLANITAPLLNITSKHDETAPYESVQVLNDLVSSRDKELLLLRGPHVGMVAGSKAPIHFWPKLADWLLAHSGPDVRVRL